MLNIWLLYSQLSGITLKIKYYFFFKKVEDHKKKKKIGIKLYINNKLNLNYSELVI